jgi:endonuclease III
MDSDLEQKLPHDIPVMLARIAAAVEPFPKAALFELAEEGWSTPFQQLAACIISIRSLDEVTLPAARRLFAQAHTPQGIAALEPAAIQALIYPCTFYERKAIQIRDIARQVADELGGELPCDLETMLSFAGVGIKCANLTLGIACGQARVSADVHVHRITNRWGYIHTSTPERSSAALEGRLPQEYFVEINRLLVPFGKHICTGRLPRCSTCPVLAYCQQVGVTRHR